MRTTSSPLGEYLWTFDSTFEDASSTFRGEPINCPSFSASTITGYGSSLSLRAAQHQSLSIGQPVLPLFNRSWTFEAWLKLHSCVSGAQYPILGQMDSRTQDKYLHLLVQDRKLSLRFLDDDLDGATSLNTLQWYHAAFVFDSITCNQSIYLDGILDGSRTANSSYQGNVGALDVGVNYWIGTTCFFDGLIDQLSFVNRTKTSEEILWDATLTVYFSFDANSTSDEGPLRMAGSVGGSTSFTSGRRGQALQIFDVPDSYFTMQGLVLLGRSDQSYSFSIWIKPDAPQKASIIHMSSSLDGGGWCVPILGLTNETRLMTVAWDGVGVEVMGQVVPATSWTHAVVTYSRNNGVRLYANGSLSNSTGSFSFPGSNTSNYLFVGSSRAAIVCVALAEIKGQYSGAVDELRVYSRELTAAEINALANP